MKTITQDDARTEGMLRQQVRDHLHYVLIPVRAADRRDGEFAWLAVSPRQVPNVLRYCTRHAAELHVQRVHYARPGTVHVYLKAGPDDWS